jgi:glycerol kinase
VLKLAKFVLSIDQSTSATKAFLFDSSGKTIARCDKDHKQIISPEGWVSHNLEEIYRNTISVVSDVIKKAGIDPSDIVTCGISNQRETAAVWSRSTGKAVCDAVVWQCSRAESIAAEISDKAEAVKSKTGLNLSPYFSAPKIAWILRNIQGLDRNDLCAGTIDSWLLFRLTGGKSFKTDYSNASRTEMFNITSLDWDEELLSLFDIDREMLAEPVMSDSLFGETDFDGILPRRIPITGIMGDSHCSLFGQGCFSTGMVKSTYGTGSSVMMNIGDKPVIGQNGVVTSVGYGMNGSVKYVLEGNINYSGSVIKWLVDDVKLLDSSRESGIIAASADPNDTTYLVPAFSGLGAPYWRSNAKAIICGMTRTTGKAEIVKAAEQSIVFQITDILNAMRDVSGISPGELRVDGGPTKDPYLMQFQSNMLDVPVLVPDKEELSAIGAAFMAGLSSGIYDDRVFSSLERKRYDPNMDQDRRNKLLDGWHEAVELASGRN